MIEVPANTRIWIVAGVTDLRRGFTGLSAIVQTVLQQNPFSGHVFVFRGKRGDLINCCGTRMADFACSRNVWNADVSSGPRPKVER
jgi:transposase